MLSELGTKAKAAAMMDTTPKDLRVLESPRWRGAETHPFEKAIHGAAFSRGDRPGRRQFHVRHKIFDDQRFSKRIFCRPREFAIHGVATKDR